MTFDVVVNFFLKKGQRVLVMISICKYLIFIAVFSGSHINDRSHRPSKIDISHLVVC